MIKISTSKITVPVIILNMAPVVVQIFGVVTLPVLKVLIHPAGGPLVVQIFGVVTLTMLKVLIHPAEGPLGRGAIRLEGVGEISGVGSLDP